MFIWHHTHPSSKGQASTVKISVKKTKRDKFRSNLHLKNAYEKKK